MAITISDVANEAGVSKSTVSKVLNHWTTISPETVARVQAAMISCTMFPTPVPFPLPDRLPKILFT